VEENVGGDLLEKGADTAFIVKGDGAAIPGDGWDVLGLEVMGEGDTESAGGICDEGFGCHNTNLYHPRHLLANLP
jgi:hypothetical protein